MKKLLFAALTIFLPISAYSEIHQCTSKNGELYFTDTGCLEGDIGKVVELQATNISEAVRAKESGKTGYELFLGPKRIGHESEWTLAQAIEHLRWYKNKNSTTQKAKGYYNGTTIFVGDISAL